MTGSQQEAADGSMGWMGKPAGTGGRILVVIQVVHTTGVWMKQWRESPRTEAERRL